MFILRLAKVDFNLIFNQGFRMLLVITSVICYSMLLTFHAFLLRPMFMLCGKDYFSVISRWMFHRVVDNPLAMSYNEITVICYLTNVLDMTVMSFGLLFLAMFLCECFLLRRKHRQMLELQARRRKASSVSDPRSSGLENGGEDARPDMKILRQRLRKGSSTTRFIGRLSLLLPSSFLSTVHLACSAVTYLLFHLVHSSIDPTSLQANQTYLDVIKWRLLVYTMLSFFLCGFHWSMSGINMSMLKAIYARSRRQDQFRRMNASVFTEGNTIV